MARIPEKGAQEDVENGKESQFQQNPQQDEEDGIRPVYQIKVARNTAPNLMFPQPHQNASEPRPKWLL